MTALLILLDLILFFYDVPCSAKHKPQDKPEKNSSKRNEQASPKPHRQLGLKTSSKTSSQTNSKTSSKTSQRHARKQGQRRAQRQSTNQKDARRQSARQVRIHSAFNYLDYFERVILDFLSISKRAPWDALPIRQPRSVWAEAFRGW